MLIVSDTDQDNSYIYNLTLYSWVGEVGEIIKDCGGAYQIKLGDDFYFKAKKKNIIHLCFPGN